MDDESPKVVLLMEEVTAPDPCPRHYTGIVTLECSCGEDEVTVAEKPSVD
jgi:hypothetical protein